MLDERPKSATANSPTPYTLTLDAVAVEQRSNLTRGLSQSEATRRLALHGPNALAPARERAWLSIFLAQFRSLIVALLVVSTCIAFSLGENVEAIAILVVIVLNAGIGFFTEWNAAQALVALQKQAVPVAHVVRDGTERELPAAELVPGDLVILAAGARVPADGRIVETARLQIEEASLTGESLAVSKGVDPLLTADTALGDRINMAFLGTTITAGRGRMLVTATGGNSEVGRIGALIDEAATRATPLEQKLARLGRLLIIVVVALCAVIVVAGWLRGVSDLWHMLEIGLSLAIAAVPEGLPAVTTMTLALGMQRIARLRALVRRLPAVETLGAVTVICTDKTGTLTRNEMTVSAYVLDQRRITVSGTGYAAKGSFLTEDGVAVPATDAHLELALRIGLLCNDATLDRSDGRESVLGDPTEAALVVAAEKAGLHRAGLAIAFPRLAEVPFDSISKQMVTVHSTQGGEALAFLKGSPATLLAASSTQQRAAGVTPLTSDDRQRWEAANQALAATGLRILGLAYRELREDFGAADLSRELTFVGLVGMSDPLREEAKQAIATCRLAGIRTIMMTGDQEATATAIAHQLGIDLGVDGHRMRTVHGRELTDLGIDAWQAIVAQTAVFARVSPEHKLRIVEALQQQGHVVAMTGDGVNDAPALKTADIGIAMGIKGTEVAKENADMVITDDNFASIVGAVEQGRIIYGNILRFLHYLLSCNLSEILTVFIALMVGWPLPLVALQILWLNLITDIFPAFALALEPSAPDAMQRPPRNPKQALLSTGLVKLIIWQGIVLSAATLLAFRIGIHWHGADADGLRRATTLAFMTLAFTQVLHAFSTRSKTQSILSSSLFTNRWLWAATATCMLLQAAAVYVPLLQRVLHTVAPTVPEWGVIAGCSLLPVITIESVKVIYRTPWYQTSRNALGKE